MSEARDKTEPRQTRGPLKDEGGSGSWMRATFQEVELREGRRELGGAGTGRGTRGEV
jgi:hypothetical protein